MDDIIGSFDEDPRSYQKAQEIVDLGEPAVPKLLDMLDDDDTDRRWASSYALSQIAFKSSDKTKADIRTAMKDSFHDPDPFVRVTTAGVAVALGDKDGIPVLIAHLDIDAPLANIEPQDKVSSYCIRVLRAFTGQDFGYDETSPLKDRVESIRKWADWWKSNKGSLVWDPGRGEYGGYVSK